MLFFHYIKISKPSKKLLPHLCDNTERSRRGDGSQTWGGARTAVAPALRMKMRLTDQQRFLFRDEINTLFLKTCGHIPWFNLLTFR